MEQASGDLPIDPAIDSRGRVPFESWLPARPALRLDGPEVARLAELAGPSELTRARRKTALLEFA